MSDSGNANAKSGALMSGVELWERHGAELFGKAREVARWKLDGPLASEIDDVACQTLHEVAQLIPEEGADWDTAVRLTLHIARKRALDHVRHAKAAKRNRSISDSLEEMTESAGIEITDEKADPVGKAILKDQERVVHEVMKELPKVRRKILVDLYLGAKSYQEVAAAHGYSIHSIGAEVNRAKAQIRTMLRDRFRSVFDELQAVYGSLILLLKFFVLP